MRQLALLMSLAVFTITACTAAPPAGEPPPRDDTSATPQPTFDDNRGDVTRVNTPEGEAAIQLVLDTTSMDAGDQLAVRLVNRGDVPVMTGLPITAERWNGTRWVTIEQHGVWPDVGILVKPGGNTEAQTWPFGGLPEPGRYRLTKTARYEGDVDEPDTKLVAVATFEVTNH